MPWEQSLITHPPHIYVYLPDIVGPEFINIFALSLSLSLSVCVCVRERERERLNQRKLHPRNQKDFVREMV